MEHHHTFGQWLNYNWAIISLIYFPAAMMYLNSVAIFFKVMGYTKLADFLAKLEQALIAARNAAKAYKQQQVHKTASIVLLCIGIGLFTGCASAGVNGLCLNIQGTGISSPYTGSGKLNANGVMCAMGGISAKGTPPTYDDLKTVMTAFINKQDGVGKLTIPGPGTITYTPDSTNK